MTQAEANIIQIDEMSSLSNDPQNKKMYLVTNKSQVINTNKIAMAGMLQLPDNTVKRNNKYSSKNVTNFCINSAVREIYKTDRRIYSDNVIIECENIYCERFTVRIRHTDFSRYLIKAEFEKQARNAIFSPDVRASKMNELLFNYIKSVMKENVSEISEKPGFQLNNGVYCFIAHTDGNEEHETDAVKQSGFEIMESVSKNINFQMLKYVIGDNRLLCMLMILDTASFMYTLLKDNGHDFRKIIAVTGCDTKDMTEVLRNFFKVYEHDNNEILSLNVKMNELRNIVFSRKDEMVIFEDDASTKNRLSENIRFLSDCCVKRRSFEDETAECNCMILCNQSQTMGVLEEYSDSVIWIDVSEIIAVKEHIFDIIELKQKIRDTIIQAAKSNKFLPMFFDSSEYLAKNGSDTTDSLLSSLHTMEIICDKVLKIGIDIGSQSGKYVSAVSDYIKESENFFDESCIAEKFRDVLSNAIIQGRIRVMNNETDENLPVLYIKDELLLITVRDFANIERQIPFGLIDRTPKSNGIRLRSILHEKGYLVTNNGDKLLYKASVSEDSSNRMNFVALKKSLLTGEAQKIVPVIRKKAISISEYQPPDNNDGMDRILLGTTLDTGLPVYWSIGNSRLSNKHLYIQADSGSGKTTLLFLLAQRLYKAGKNVIILDFAETESYSEHKIAYMNNNLIKNTRHSVFENGVSESDIKHCDFHSYISEINNSSINIIHCTPMEAVNILKNIFNSLNNNNHNHENDIYVILDEINSLNFDEKFSENNDQTVADVIFRQGRSIGLNLVSATQFLSKKGSKNKAQLFNQSATKIVLHMNSSSSTGVAKSISVSGYSYYKEVLEKMTIGQAIVYSGVERADNSITNDIPLKIKISPFSK